jgi:hypothetical protein
MNDDKFYSMLSTFLPCPVYRDFVPENETSPAVSFIDVSHTFNRVLDGSKSGRKSTWRVSVVASTSSEISTLVNLIETLDNTVTDEFQRVFIIYQNGDPQSDPDQKYYLSTIDIQTYEG